MSSTGTLAPPAPELDADPVLTPAPPAPPATDASVASEAPEDLADVLVEEVSIDGMCGVY